MICVPCPICITVAIVATTSVVIKTIKKGSD
jgi:hypothetical protein